MRVAKTIVLTDHERSALTKWARGRSTPARLVLRAKIILAAGNGELNPTSSEAMIHISMINVMSRRLAAKL